MGLLQPQRCALVTVQDSLRHLPWAVVFDSASAMLDAIPTMELDAVFSDFGPLADGSSGTRLARAIVGHHPKLRVYLLSSHPDLHQAWSKAFGAAGVLARNVASLAPVLAVPKGMPQPPEVTRPGGLSTTSIADVRRLAQRLNAAGMGPAASVLVERAINQLAGTLDDIPDLRDIAGIVGRHLPEGPDRVQFMREFEVSAS